MLDVVKPRTSSKEQPVEDVEDQAQQVEDVEEQNQYPPIVEDQILSTPTNSHFHMIPKLGVYSDIASSSVDPPNPGPIQQLPGCGGRVRRPR